MQAFALPANWNLLGDGWTASTKASKDPNFELALSCCESSYQEDLIYGRQAWSGSTLKGKAKKYSGRYATTRRGLENRLRTAGAVFSFQTLGSRRVLCIGELPPAPIVQAPIAPSVVIHTIDDLLRVP